MFSLYTLTVLEEIIQYFGSIQFNLPKILQYKVTVRVSWNLKSQFNPNTLKVSVVS